MWSRAFGSRVKRGDGDGVEEGGVAPFPLGDGCAGEGVRFEKSAVLVPQVNLVNLALNEETTVPTRELEPVWKPPYTRLERFRLVVIVLARLDFLHDSNHRVGRVEEGEDGEVVGMSGRGEVAELLHRKR